MGTRQEIRGSENQHGRLSPTRSVTFEVRFRDDEDAWVAILTGTGQVFCAGADIKEQRGPETSIEVRQRMEKSRWIEAIDQIHFPEGW